MPELNDEDLVVLARGGDTEAFLLLLERYQPMAFAIALRQVFQSGAAQDLVREAIIVRKISYSWSY